MTDLNAELKSMMSEEMSRISREGSYNDGFWQTMIDRGGRLAYHIALRDRGIEAAALARLALDAEAKAGSVDQKRAARKMARRAKTLAGLEKLYKRDRRNDPLFKRLEIDLAWIIKGRRVATAIANWHASTSK